jgi:hypothetical protein
MSDLETIVVIGFLIIVVQLMGINGKFKELKGIGEGIRSDLKGILEEIGCEYEDTSTGKRLVKWGVKDILENILEEIGCEYANSADSSTGKTVTRWSVKYILEDIQGDLKEIQKKIDALDVG